ncbi:hypothetical protein DVH05_016889 [Phytophthora capsici]|nr:hypothetical protein DVH05_016889 [Phytophthora capsici]
MDAETVTAVPALARGSSDAEPATEVSVPVSGWAVQTLATDTAATATMVTMVRASAAL